MEFTGFGFFSPSKKSLKSHIVLRKKMNSSVWTNRNWFTTLPTAQLIKNKRKDKSNKLNYKVVLAYLGKKEALTLIKETA